MSKLPTTAHGEGVVTQSVKQYYQKANEFMSGKPVFIRGDLNALQDGVLPLRNLVWISLLRRIYGEIRDGQQIWLYDLVGADDPTIFPGVIRDVGRVDEYEILVNESDFEYMSQSKQFPTLTREDLENGWKEEVKNHPEYYLGTT